MRLFHSSSKSQVSSRKEEKSSKSHSGKKPALITDSPASSRVNYRYLDAGIGLACLSLMDDRRFMLGSLLPVVQADFPSNGVIDLATLSAAEGLIIQGANEHDRSGGWASAAGDLLLNLPLAQFLHRLLFLHHLYSHHLRHLWFLLHQRLSLRPPPPVNVSEIVQPVSHSSKTKHSIKNSVRNHVKRIIC